MIFSDDMLNTLRRSIRNYLSEKRYIHTLSVERAALKIARACGYEDASEISAAALLHDISKEYSEAEHKKLIKSYNICISHSDELSPQILHSITAVAVVERDFPSFATEAILSAVRKHTTADANMSLFDEIIFVADYIEDGRTYDKCIQLREWLYSSLESADTKEKRIDALHGAVLRALENTISSLRARGQHVHEKSILAYNEYAGIS